MGQNLYQWISKKNVFLYVKNHGTSDEHRKIFKKITDTSIIFKKTSKNAVMSDRHFRDFRSQIVFWFQMIIILMVTSIFEKTDFYRSSALTTHRLWQKYQKNLMVFEPLEFIFWVFTVNKLLPTGKTAKIPVNSRG